jgi:hypothetical protein
MEITYKQLLDYTVGVLYELRVKNKKTGYFSLKEIVNFFDYDANFDGIKDIAKYLEAQGYVKAIFNYGDVFVELTTRGIVNFEEKNDVFVKSFNDFVKKDELQEKFKILIGNSEKEIYSDAKSNLITELSDFKKSTSTRNNKELLKDFFSDLDILILELKKDNPDNEILAHKTNKLLENIKLRDKLSKILSKLNLD